MFVEVMQCAGQLSSPARTQLANVCLVMCTVSWVTRARYTAAGATAAAKASSVKKKRRKKNSKGAFGSGPRRIPGAPEPQWFVEIVTALLRSH